MFQDEHVNPETSCKSCLQLPLTEEPMTRLTLLISLLVCLAAPIDAQKKTVSSLCTPENALDTTKQQILITRTFDSRVLTSDNPPARSFAEQVEAAEKLTDVGRRDQGLTFAVTGSSKDEPVDNVLSVIDKISESSIRDALVNWVYYFRSQALIKDKNFSEARKFASKVTELDQRAYLYTRITEESLKANEDLTEVREMLNEVANQISKAPKTIVSARALLALARLYSNCL